MPNLAYNFPVPWQRIDVLTCYNDFSICMRDEGSFDDPWINTTGCAIGAGPLFIYADVIQAQNAPFFSSGNPLGRGGGAWDTRFNLNLGYYFWVRSMHPLALLQRTRRWIRGAARGGLLAGACFPAGAAAEDLTSSLGGTYTKSRILGFIQPFEERRGLDVEVVDYEGGLEEIRSQVVARNVKWDVVDLELEDALRACRQDLLVEIAPAELLPLPEGVPAKEDFLIGSLTRCPANFGEGKAPERIEGFFGLGEYPGRRGMRRPPKGNLEWALIADGVSPDRVYEVLDTEKGLDRAFRVLSRIKPCIVWWEAGTEAVRMPRRDRVRMTTGYSGRIWEANTDGTPAWP